MTVSPLRLFSPEFADPVDPTSQVDRIPGTADAACMCPGGDRSSAICDWPFCTPPIPESCKPSEKEDE